MKENFDELVDLAMANPALTHMRPVVEKELLHYDIFNALDSQGLLRSLVFQGGTSLRLCRGSNRFSEDLDFAGGRDFNAQSMASIKSCIEKQIGERYGLVVNVKEPKPSSPAPGSITVDKWMVSIETSPGNRALPRQKIKLEIANVPSYTSEAVPLRLNYDFLLGQHPVLVNSESLSEILADKIVAFPTSVTSPQGTPNPLDSNRLRHRDIWDIAWLMQRRSVEVDVGMVRAKIADYGITNYPDLLSKAIDALPSIVHSNEFKAQMGRFIDAETTKRAMSTPAHFDYMQNAVADVLVQVRDGLSQSETDQDEIANRPWFPRP